MLNQVNLFGAFLSASGQLQERVELFLDLHRFGSLVAAMFFGLWLLPLGLLVFKPGFLTKSLGILLMFGSLGYPRWPPKLLHLWPPQNPPPWAELSAA
jgi:hypothetical protein